MSSVIVGDWVCGSLLINVNGLCNRKLGLMCINHKNRFDIFLALILCDVAGDFSFRCVDAFGWIGVTIYDFELNMWILVVYVDSEAEDGRGDWIYVASCAHYALRLVENLLVHLWLKNI